MKIQIPIYRARICTDTSFIEETTTDEYIEGNLIEDEGIFYIVKNIVLTTYNGWLQICDECEFLSAINPSTLAIHFPDMIDSEGNKIFASLSEDGKGGDILKFSHLNETMFYSNCRFFAGNGLEFFTIKEISKKIEITGIQE